ncbi:MAG TPA: hypothetical protein VFS26_01200 [Solirubrobacterales bacterium]|nr:hypothetical protein [Solirubrobacterales bacterium]
MKLMRSTWTDSRLDDLNGRVADLSTKVNEMDNRLTGRIDSLQHTMVHGFIALAVAMLTGFLGLAGVLITKL